ncbi:hypothetical protein DIS18_09015 [Algibacter marinivivus]|uniref:HAD-superfamily subfamily IB hydrolase, TIGR01490 n=1 Tax=Algibacter marinivivus TaxID=2100723 RepID=A0A2U2X3M4_9FLAO|nr:HAD-IB family phosphatase [Algibacter marinivivus]PWH82383.1 hypothetical protein DIS18_09015 [Algibacter marinivivus]
MKLVDKTIAVFDLDGTITSKDTYLEFIKYFNGQLNFYIGIIILSPFIVLFYLGLLNNVKLKELFFSFFFKKFNASEIVQKGVEFSTKILPSLCYKSALKVLKWHEDNNHDILILTASSDIWLEHWCKSKNYKLICTKFEKINDNFTGKIDGKNCFGEQKKVLLIQYFKNHNYTYSFGYGDSKSDKHYLDIVDESYLMSLNDKNVSTKWKK